LRKRLRFLIGFLLGLVLLLPVPVNVSAIQDVESTSVNVNVPIYLAIGSVPDTVIVVTDPTLEKTYAKVSTFSIDTNVPAILSVPPLGTLTRLGGTETLIVQYFIDPESVTPPGQESCFKVALIFIDGLKTMAGTYQGTATITLTQS